MIVRHWFPVIAGGVTLTLVLVFAMVHSNRVQNASHISAEVVDTKASAQSEEDYQRAVREILATYAQDNDAHAAYDTLLYVTGIPANMKDVHIGLVGALGKIAAGDREDGELRLQALRVQYSWLTL